MKKKFVQKILKLVYLVFLISFMFVIINFQKNEVLNNSKDFDNLFLVNQGIFEENCRKIYNFYLMDYCYTVIESCNNIKDSISSYYCNRLNMRPHMWSFVVTHRDFENISGFINYNSLVREITIQPKLIQKLDLCSQKFTGKFQEQCKFFVGFGLIEQLPNNLNSFSNFCLNFNSIQWTSECYYLIADELTYLNNSNYLKNISKLCYASNQAYDYSCYHHTAINMPLDHIKSYCGYADVLYKEQCYEGYGYKLGFDNDLSSLGLNIEICNDLVEYNDSCVIGLIQSISTYSKDDKQNFYLESCKQIPDQYRNLCYQQYGHDYAFFETLGIVEYCSIVEDNYVEDCFFGIGTGLDMIAKSNLDIAINICKETNTSLVNQNYCLKGVLWQLGRYGIKDNSCELFPIEFKTECNQRVI